MRKLRYVANQNPTLGPIIMSLCDLIKTKPNQWHEEIIKSKQKKLSEITDMIHAAHVFHRCVREKTTDRIIHQESIMSLLFGDYLLAQSSVDMADLRYPRTVGLIARGLEDYTRGEFLKFGLFKPGTQNHSSITAKQELYDGVNLYAKLTCGSLLSNACLSAALLAGYPDRCPSSSAETLGDVVFRFGLHTGTAHRLLELFFNPDTNSELDREFIESNLDSRDFRETIQSHLNKSREFLLKLPNGDERLSLLKLLDTMQKRSSVH